MANIDVPWAIQGIISPEESVRRMIDVIQSKGIQHSGTFWTWEDKVSLLSCTYIQVANLPLPALCLVTLQDNISTTRIYNG
jgi:hypothetical protein